MASFDGLIPLGLPLAKNKGADVRSRLWLLNKIDLYHDEMKTFLDKSIKKTFSAADEKKLRSFLKHKELAFTEVDRGLIFTHAFVQNISSFPTKLVKSLDNDPWLTSKHYGTADKALIRRLEEGFSDSSMFLSYVRAKLAFRELAYLILKDDNIILELLGITLKYLSCTVISRHIELMRDERIYSKNKTDSKKFVQQVSSLIQGNTKEKKRQSWYWRGQYYFAEIKSCIETFNLIKDESQKASYLKAIKVQWYIPTEYTKLINTKEDTPTNLALGVLESRGIIDSGEQFLKGYRKTIKTLKDSNIAINLLPSEIFSIFDIMSINPLVFTKLDPFSYLNHQNYIKATQLIKNH